MFLLLIDQGLSSGRSLLLFDELLLHFVSLLVLLQLMEFSQLSGSLSLFFKLSLLGLLKLLVSDLPVFSELRFFFLLHLFLLLLSFHLHLTTSFDGVFHILLPSFLLLELLSRFQLGLLDLLVEIVLTHISGAHEVCDLSVDQLLAFSLLFLELLRLFILAQLLEPFLLDSKVLYPLVLLGLFLSLDLLHVHLLSISLFLLFLQRLEIRQPLGLILSLFPHLVLDLSLEEFTLQHVLLHLPDISQFEIMQLIFDHFGSLNLLVVLVLQLFSVLLILVGQALALLLIPLLVDGVLELLLTSFQLFLLFALCEHI